MSGCNGKRPHRRVLILYAQVARVAAGGSTANTTRTLRAEVPSREIQFSCGVFSEALDGGPAPIISGCTWTFTPAQPGEKGGPLEATPVRSAQALPDSWESGNSSAKMYVGTVAINTAAPFSGTARGQLLAIATFEISASDACCLTEAEIELLFAKCSLIVEGEQLNGTVTGAGP